MKNKGISIAAILIICVFVATIAALGFSVYSAYKLGSEKAADRFEKLSSRTMELSGIYPCGSKEFLTAFNDSVNAPNFYEQLRLEVDGIEVYIYPSFPMSTPSAFAKTFSTRIIGGDGARLELSANIYALSPATIFNRAKIAFIVILGGTLITGILLVFTYLSEAEGSEKIVDSKLDEPVFSDDEVTEDDLNLTEEDLSEENLDNLDGENAGEKKSEPKPENENPPPHKVEKQNVPATEEAHPAQKNTDPISQTESEESNVPHSAEPSDLATEEIHEESPAQIETQPSSIEKNSDEQKNEQGLFSPTSGFGWESYLDTRLGSELIRAASSEQELSLLMIKIPGMTQQSEYYEKVCKTLLDFFQFKDFVFEYKEDGFAAIIQGKGIDEAMESAERLYANLKSTLNKERANTRPLIGISSRSLRLISAERLKTEAEQATEHASTDNESPIVAFRVNPEKYRKFINEQTEE